MKQFTLGKKERLKSRKQIDQLFGEGKNFPLSPFRIYYRLMPLKADSSTLQFGAGVSAKNFKRAVDRNRIKRQLRECYREEKEKLYEFISAANKQYALMIVFTNKNTVPFNELMEKLAAVIQRLKKDIK